MFFMTYSNYHADTSQIDKDTVSHRQLGRPNNDLIDREIEKQLADYQAKEQVYRRIDS